MLSLLDWAAEGGGEPREVAVQHLGRAAHLAEAYLLPMARRAYAARLAAVPPKVRVLPGPLRRMLGLVNPTLAALGEMRFQWDRPYVVDHAKWAARFGTPATPLAEGLAATVAHYRRAATP